VSKRFWRCGHDIAGSDYIPLRCFWEYRNEPLVSVKVENFLTGCTLDFFHVSHVSRVFMVWFCALKGWVWWLSRNANKMQYCNRIYYSKVYWKLSMFRAAHRSSSGALNCICSLWFIYPCGDRPLRRLSGVPLETCWAFNKLRNNKFYYNTASCWYLYRVIYDARIHEYQI